VTDRGHDRGQLRAGPVGRLALLLFPA